MLKNYNNLYNFKINYNIVKYKISIGNVNSSKKYK